MKKKGLISIIVPAYNVEKHIGRCLESIQKQTYPNIEIMVVNDGSTDDTRKVVEQYALEDSRIILINTKNQGVSCARKEGISKAQGEYIGFVDGDDLIDSDMYEILLNNMLAYDADISHCGYKMCFDDGRIRYFHNTKQTKVQDNVTGLTDLLEGKLIEPGLCNKLYKKSLLDRMIKENNMDYTVKHTEDLLMNYILFSYSEKAVFADVCKYHYIVRKGSATRNGLNISKIEDPIKVKALILKMAEEKVRSVAEKVYISTLINSYNAIEVENSGKYIKEKKGIRKELIRNRKLSSQLSGKTKFLYRIIYYCPFLYGKIYRIYYKHIMDKKYE
ncbi:MAG: glycosyltransferase [Eubacteriales bacterium]|nr:glycosyltransferase [Eubacteriales bacterium]